ncbi:NUDIX hydrolase [Parafilimonas sp.]|uniref:NUDIX hydrolase n=1 Tax=Parafilimonas sp. TaxID=1969739 RepID=UPI003F8100DA
MAITKYTVRVYGILLDDNSRILVSDEFIRGDYFTKFPGGGLELGEGTRDCLKREFKEETGLDVIVGDHIYTTDYFQQSAFNAFDQIISIYYFVQAEGLNELQVKTKVFDFELHQIADPKGQSEVLRWVEWNELTEESVSLPIDKIVVRFLKNTHR